MYNYLDFNGDGFLDTMAVMDDYNGDGIVDGTTYYTDSNYDGFYDQISFVGDTNNDGIADAFVSQCDTNGDGYMETTERMYDYDQDGFYDSHKSYQDWNYDGQAELVSNEYVDKNGIHTIDTDLDYNGDGVADESYTEQRFDSDGDGFEESSYMEMDYDGDGNIDNAGYFYIDAVSQEYYPVDYWGAIPSNGALELDNFDPSQSDPELVSGDPGQSMEEWEFQGDTNRCALYSQKFVIEELTGKDVPIEDIVDIATENGWFSEDSGTASLNMTKVLDAYGIENEMSFHNDIDDIKKCLEDGGKVIVSIDADQVWYGEDSNIFSPADSANHAVEVIGIDYSNPEEPMVILNDSGSPNGCGEMVAMDVFEDAWAAGDKQMVECYA